MDKKKTICSADTYLAILNDEDPERSKMARCIPVATEVWFELLRRGYPKDSILLHKHLSLEILEYLSCDSDPRIRALVADKRASATILPILAEDPNPLVRTRVAYNAKVSQDILEKLSNDSSLQVANAAKGKLEIKIMKEKSKRSKSRGSGSIDS